jgi:hypothetical protein
MTQKHILIFGLITFLLTSCYEDEGNYVYTDINEVSIADFPETITIDRFETIEIKPVLSGTLYEDESNYTYEWQINKKVVSTERDLKYLANDNIGNYTLRLSVIDKNNETRSFAVSKLIINSASSDDGILIASTYKNKVDLSYLRLDKQNAAFSKIFYNQTHPEETLGTRPRQLYQTYVDGCKYFMGYQPNQSIKLISDESLIGLSSVSLDATVKIDGQFFLNFGSLYPIPDYSAYSPDYITGFVYQWRLSPYGSVFNTEYIWVISKGTIYNYGLERSANPFSIYTVNFDGDKQYYFSPVIFETGRTPTADAGTNRNAGWTGTYHQVTFDEISGNFYDYYFETMTVIDESVKFNGYKAFYGEDTYQQYLGFAALKKDNNVKLVLLSNLNKLSESTVTGVDAPLVNPNSRFFMLRNTPYVFFNTKDAVYKYNVLNVNTSTPPAAGDRIVSLSDLGYSSDAVITDICLHRSEKKLLITISRYGSDNEALSEELKGDLIEINVETSPATVVSQYPSVCGSNALVIYKYRTFARNDEKIVD